MSSISNRPMRMSATVRMQSRHCALPTRMSTAGLPLDAEEAMDARAGACSPIRSVFWPLWAMVSARFTIVVVLPSCSVGLVTTSTLPCRSVRTNWMFVRSVR